MRDERAEVVIVKGKKAARMAAWGRSTGAGGRVVFFLGATHELDCARWVDRYTWERVDAGVPEEALAHLFEPFYRVGADRDRSSGGVGLGLAITRRAVDLHHGTVRASNAHPGLAIEIDLPVAL